MRRRTRPAAVRTCRGNGASMPTPRLPCGSAVRLPADCPGRARSRSPASWISSPSRKSPQRSTSCYDRVMNDVLVPVSPGELLDKITILRIKSARITDPAKVGNVRLELGLLEKTWRDSGCAAGNIAAEERALHDVNERLWDIEDRIREKEAQQTFDRDFIELARAVYVFNDERAAIKKRVNLALGSRIVEEKSYKAYLVGGPKEPV